MKKSKINYAELLKKSGGNMAGAIVGHVATEKLGATLGGNFSPLMVKAGVAVAGTLLMGNRNPVLSSMGFGLQAPLALELGNRIMGATMGSTTPPAPMTFPADVDAEGTPVGGMLTENVAGMITENVAGAQYVRGTEEATESAQPLV